MILALQLVRLVSEKALEVAFLPVPSRTLFYKEYLCKKPADYLPNQLFLKVPSTDLF